ncbi:RNA-guided endonuclease InsQ/TnpB family protein [Nocardiopsis sp. NPDC057823]|uniref:RNA-guided endonuclease InsQ/TnpB family protein n=1 Tax=Nocardiopsis sp. NPDC057823 TaxID=3346256 RepID=UPI00366E7283
MPRFRLYPTHAQEAVLFGHCAQARHTWNLAWEVNNTYRRGGARTACPVRYAGMAAMLTEVRRTPANALTPEEAGYFAWVASGNVEIQQQALRDFDQALVNFFNGSHGYPNRRKKHHSEGFRVIGTSRTPAFDKEGRPVLNTKGEQVMSRAVTVQKSNKKWAQVKVPGAGWVRFRNTRRALPEAKSFRVTYRTGRWYVAFAVKPAPISAPGNSTTVGVDRGVAITAALSDGRVLNCPQPSARERARLLKHQRRAACAPKGSPKRRDEYARIARLREKEANRRRDWVEKTSTMLARSFDTIRFEDLKIRNMTRSAKGTMEEPGRRVAQKAGLNRAILAQGWGLLRTRTGHKAPGRVEDVPAAYTSLRCSDCGWVDKNSRKSQAEFICSSCGFTCNADLNASNNVAAGQGGTPAPAPRGRAGGTTGHKSVSVREPQQLLLFE